SAELGAWRTVWWRPRRCPHLAGVPSDTLSRIVQPSGQSGFALYPHGVEETGDHAVEAHEHGQLDELIVAETLGGGLPHLVGYVDPVEQFVGEREEGGVGRGPSALGDRTGQGREFFIRDPGLPSDHHVLAPLVHGLAAPRHAQHYQLPFPRG